VKIDTALQGVAEMFLDTAPVIYFVERNPTYAALVDNIFNRIDSGARHWRDCNVGRSQIFRFLFYDVNRLVDLSGLANLGTCRHPSVVARVTSDLRTNIIGAPLVDRFVTAC
jgi:hypothetical protein